MSKLSFTLNLPSLPEKLIELASDYEKFVNYLPDQIKSVKIVEKNNDETITEEILVFSSYIKTEITQKALHKKTKPNELYTEIISGPFIGSSLTARFDKTDSGTKVTIDVNLKIPLKYKLATVVIKKYYKIFLTSVLYKMNNVSINS